MHVASRSLAAGANFVFLGPNETMLKSSPPVIAITAVRTGCGKSAVARWLSHRLRERALRVAVLRHPMPYGDLAGERMQRFASIGDLDAAQCSAEEREEYEPHIALGNIVFAGVDYAEIVRGAEREADIIVLGGGNNDFPLVRPDLHIALADALHPRQVATHHPGETVARMAGVLVINKVNAVPAEDVRIAEHELRAVNPAATIVRATSPITLNDPAAVKSRRVLVIEDGPTITHGGMPHGAGYVAARDAGAEVVDPRNSADLELRKIFETYPHIGKVLPAVGYSPAQLAALGRTINNAAVDAVISATPLDLGGLLRVDKTIVRARYEFADTDEPRLSTIIDSFIGGLARGTRKE
jgi:predicted GTPase